MDSRSLQPGDELRCPHCGRWHQLVTRHTDGTPYTRDMLYWQCRGEFYYAAQTGSSSRHQTRKATAA